LLGIYVHTHWAYNRPYAARTWSLADWKGFLAGMASLGYDHLLLWPLLDAMPERPTPSDVEYLRTAHQVIDHAHNRFGMQVAVVVCANTMGNEHAADYAYYARPYFRCERKINPRDSAEVQRFLTARERVFRPIANADTLTIIDSDPGGYVGSSNAEFVGLVQRQVDLFRRFNKHASFAYWMLYGWETYNKFWARIAACNDKDSVLKHPSPASELDVDVFVETLTLLRDRLAEPWRVYVGFDEHFEATERLGMADKRAYFPYGLIEREPSFPLIEYSLPAITAGISRVPASARPCGLLGNAQTHCLQLPNLYLFAHFARGGTEDNVAIDDFGDNLLPGHGAMLARAWRAIAGNDPQAQRSLAAAVRSRMGGSHRLGPCSGMLFGDADRFLGDLADNLSVRAALIELGSTLIRGQEPRPALQQFLACFGDYQRRTGFVDAYGGTLYRLLNEPLARLGDERVDRVLRQCDDWRDPTARHQALVRLLDVLAHYGSPS
jgi:hypothetical protein